MLKKKIIIIVNLIQRVLLAVSLFVVYYIVFGLTLITAVLFNRRILNCRHGLKESSWVEASGYEPDISESKRQS